MAKVRQVKFRHLYPQIIQGTDDALPALIQHMGINHRRLQFAMPQQRLKDKKGVRSCNIANSLYPNSHG